MRLVVSDEMIGPTKPDIYSQILGRMAEGDRRRRIDELAAECGDRAFAELLYLPCAGNLI